MAQWQRNKHSIIQKSSMKTKLLKTLKQALESLDIEHGDIVAESGEVQIEVYIKGDHPAFTDVITISPAENHLAFIFGRKPNARNIYYETMTILLPLGGCCDQCSDKIQELFYNKKTITLILKKALAFHREIYKHVGPNVKYKPEKH